jgi:glycosyltransferase involved in cell wall biosynthesis
MPRVSLLLPVRDAAPTLERALASCLTQTWRDLEIIAVDDHSRDGSSEILRAAAEHDPRVQVIPAPDSGGIVTALQTAVGAARGELLARMDADDVCHPTRIERQVALLDAQPDLALVGCQVSIRKPDGDLGEGYARYQEWLNACLTPEQIARERFIESPLPHPSVMMRCDALEAAGGYRDVPWAEDYDLWLRMLAAGMRIAKVPEVLLEWEDGESRLSRRDGRYSLENFQHCKAHHLARIARMREHGAVIWGAGPIGKRMARFLCEEGIAVHRFVEVNPRRIGKRIGGVTVCAVGDIGEIGDTVHLGAVGQPGRRHEVRRCLLALGGTEGQDFLCVA